MDRVRGDLWSSGAACTPHDLCIPAICLRSTINRNALSDPSIAFSGAREHARSASSLAVLYRRVCQIRRREQMPERAGCLPGMMVRTMPDLVGIVLTHRAPGQVRQPVISLVTVEMSSNGASRRRPHKRGKHKSMDRFGIGFAMATQDYLEIPAHGRRRSEQPPSVTPKMAGLGLLDSIKGSDSSQVGHLVDPPVPSDRLPRLIVHAAIILHGGI